MRTQIKKSFFVVIDGSEDVLYLKCVNLDEAIKEVKRYLGVSVMALILGKNSKDIEGLCEPTRKTYKYL